MAYISPEELHNASVDAGTLEKFTLGGVGEPNINRRGNNVLTLATINERALEIARQAANMQTYLTKAEADAAQPQPEKTVAQVTNDPATANNGNWVSDGSQWIWSGVQPVDMRAFDLASQVRPSVPDGTDLSTVRKIGQYALGVASTYVDLPQNWPGGGGTLEVERTTNTSRQTLRLINRSWISWTRSTQGNPDTAPFAVWVQPGYDFNETIENGDVLAPDIPGTYDMRGTPTNLPAGFPDGGAILRVERVGWRTVREVYPVNDPGQTYRRLPTGGWSQIAGKGLNAQDNFTNSFRYREQIDGGDVNDLLADGLYIMRGGDSKNLPPNPTGTATAFVDVRRVGGAFVFQTVQYRQSMQTRYERSGSIAGGVATWDANWQAFSSVASESRFLEGKNIAVIGDSIVEGRYVGGKWPSMLAAATGATVNKFGFAGLRMTSYPTSLNELDKMCGYNLARYIASGDFSELLAAAAIRTEYMSQSQALADYNWSTCDYLFFCFGTNDWTKADQLIGDGFDPDPTGSTIRGTTSYVIETLAQAHPQMKILFALPAYRADSGGSGDDDCWVPRTSNGLMLADVVDNMADVAGRFGAPALDLLRTSGVNKNNYQHFYVDTVHPNNDYGDPLWAERHIGFIRTLAQSL